MTLQSDGLFLKNENSQAQGPCSVLLVSAVAADQNYQDITGTDVSHLVHGNMESAVRLIYILLH